MNPTPLRVRWEILIDLFLYCNLLRDVLPCARWLPTICKVLTHFRSLSLLLHSCCLAVPYIMYFLGTYRFANPAQNSSTVVSPDSIATGICGDCRCWVECEPDSNGLLQVSSVMITDHLCLYSQQVKYTHHYFCELIL